MVHPIDLVVIMQSVGNDGLIGQEIIMVLTDRVNFCGVTRDVS